MSDELLTIQEVAGMMKCHHMTVRRMAKDGKLPLVRLGPKANRIPRKAVEEYIKKQTEVAK